jgi:GT2 family glycosyltransferase
MVHLAVVGMVAPGKNQDLVIDCIESFLETTRGAAFDVRVTAVDNSPGSGLAERFRRRFRDIEVIENREPRGWSANLNAAIQGSAAEYLLLANDDLVFLPGALSRAVAFLEEAGHQRVGMVGFRLENPDGSLQPSTFSFPRLGTSLLSISGLREWIPFRAWTNRLARLAGRGPGRSRFWSHDRTLPVETFSGAVMLVRAAAVQDVGPLDETTLAGGEETDWHRRFWRGGWEVVFLHDARAIHYGSQTVLRVPAVQVEFTKGLLNFFWKHHPRMVYYLFCAVAAPLVAVRGLVCRLRGRPTDATVLADCARLILRWGVRGVPGRTS